MNNYQEYDAYALSRDPSFRRWVLDDSPGDAAFWTNWLGQNPDRAATIEQARAFITAVHRQYQSSITAEEVKAGVDRIVAQAKTERTPEPAVIPLNSRRLGWIRWAAAAMLLLAVGLGWQLTRPTSDLKSIATSQSATGTSSLINRTNTATKPLTILLTDGSVVTLEPGGRLQYPRRFVGKQRTVTLTGEAFFEVAHRPQQPFVVTTNDFTTTVLGTSFRVRSSSPQHRAFVIVRSGKVAVQARLKTGTPASVNRNPVILTRNQQITTGKQSQQPFVKTPVQDVELIVNEVNREQVFEDVSVAKVFDALGKQYGVAIDYDRATLSRCSVNTSFGQENLRERLSAVCQAVGATYQIVDDKVLVSSSGCTL